MKAFIYDGVVTGRNFCDRPEEISRLLSYIEDSTNVLLFAKRRMGKTSLVQEIFENRIDKSKIVAIYADIYDITDEADLAKELYRAIASALKSDLGSVMKSLKSFFHRVSFDISIGQDGTPTFSPKLTSADHELLLADVFEGLSQYLKKNNLKAAFCIDEFQQIKSIKKPLDATIRKHIQKHHHISYIFTGSKRHTLSMLFKGEKSPLMGMVTPMELGPIDQLQFYHFAKKHIQELTPDFFEQIYLKAFGETKLVQHFLRVSANAPKLVIEEIEKSVYLEVEAIARPIFEALTPNAKKVIKILSKNNSAEGVMSKDVLKEYNISKSSLKSALDQLINHGLIYLDLGTYQLDGGIGASFHFWAKKALESH